MIVLQLTFAPTELLYWLICLALQLTLELGNGTMDNETSCAHWNVERNEWVVDGEVYLPKV